MFVCVYGIAFPVRLEFEEQYKEQTWSCCSLRLALLKFEAHCKIDVTGVTGNGKTDWFGNRGSGEASSEIKQDVTGNTGSGEAVKWSRQDVTGDMGSS